MNVNQKQKKDKNKQATRRQQQGMQCLVSPSFLPTNERRRLGLDFCCIRLIEASSASSFLLPTQCKVQNNLLLSPKISSDRESEKVLFLSSSSAHADWAHQVENFRSFFSPLFDCDVDHDDVDDAASRRTTGWTDGQRDDDDVMLCFIN